MTLHTLRENFWWILVLMALAAALLLGPTGHYQPGDSVKRDSRSSDYWDWKPTHPFF